MSAVLGGTQSLHTNALDEAMACRPIFSPDCAQHAADLAEETGVTKVVDPLAALITSRS